MSGQTILLDNDGSDEVANAVIEHSRASFATKHVEPEEKPAEEPVTEGAAKEEVTGTETKVETE